MTLKHISELWVSSATVEDLHNQLRKYNQEVLVHDAELLSASFKFNVEVFCNTQSYSEKINKIEVRDDFHMDVIFISEILIVN